MSQEFRPLNTHRPHSIRCVMDPAPQSSLSVTRLERALPGCMLPGRAPRTLAGMTLTLALLLPGCAADHQEEPAKTADQVSLEKARNAEEQKLLQNQPVTPQTLPAVAAERMMLDEVATTAKREKRQTTAFGANTGGIVGPIAAAPADFYPSGPVQEVDREGYQHLDDNPVKLVKETPVSTFSIDVDTQSYSNVRRLLNQGVLPRQDAVKVEEMVNYFDYAYTPPKDLQVPFSVSTELAPSPWSDNYLLRIGLKGYDKASENLPASNLVFLIDVSGSMSTPDKLPLVQQSLRLLVNRMRPQDRISLVVYAGAEGLVLEPTSGDQKAKILAHIDQLGAGGSTNGGAGIQLAYQVARQAFIEGGINRIVLASDGDFNVGMVDLNALKDLVVQQRKDGIGLTTLAFGSGNTQFELMEQLADQGNGNAAYIDTLREANKVLVQQMSSTLMTIAKDVKIQLEFNPEVVSEYRLIGYENRLLNREDFKNDQVDAGEIGAGHTVTAYYEITLNGQPSGLVDPLRYGGEAMKAAASNASRAELAFLKMRYKQPDADKSQEISQPIRLDSLKKDLNLASPEFRFGAAVAGFGQLLRGAKYLRSGFGYAEVEQLAQQAQAKDPYGYKGEFLQLVNLASSLTPTARSGQPDSVEMPQVGLNQPAPVLR